MSYENIVYLIYLLIITISCDNNNNETSLDPVMWIFTPFLLMGRRINNDNSTIKVIMPNGTDLTALALKL